MIEPDTPAGPTMSSPGAEVTPGSAAVPDVPAVPAVPAVPDVPAAKAPVSAAVEPGQPPLLGPEHVPVAERLSLVSWGDGSAPSLPSIDDGASMMSLDDGDSALGSYKSSTMSVRSSIYHFVEEHGRTYHRYREGKYLLPNDEQEQERLDLQHALFVFTAHGNLYLSPIGDNPQNVLDIATGTGIWAIEFAQKFPGAQVVGTDLSPIQPAYVPPNCQFFIDDAEEDWEFSQKFDFIHGRALITCFRDPSQVIQQAYHAIAPGGYLEMQDPLLPFSFAGTVDPNCAFARWSDLLGEGGAKSGRPWTNTHHYRRWMEEAGFEDVVERRFYWPLGPWAKGEYYKTIGALFQQDMLNGLEGISFKILGLLGWGIDEIRVFLADVRKDMINHSAVRAYIPIIFVYGRKPSALPPSA